MTSRLSFLYSTVSIILFAVNLILFVLHYIFVYVKDNIITLNMSFICEMWLVLHIQSSNEPTHQCIIYLPTTVLTLFLCTMPQKHSV